VRILGVDPGSRFTGFGVVDYKAGQFIVIDYGVIKIKPVGFPERLQQIFEDLGEVIAFQKPTTMAIEQVFVAKNPSSALKLGHARGAAMLAGSCAGLFASEYSALQIKKAIVGTGRADKPQMQKMIMLLLGLTELPQNDAADALSVALCHGQSLASMNTILSTNPLLQKGFRNGRARRR